MSASDHHRSAGQWRTLDEREGVLPARGARMDGPAISPRRRQLLQLMGASLALAGTGGCTRAPLETIVPYRDGPAEMTYGKPVFYASALSRDGYGAGVLIECNMGRPTKIEGNPTHPASLGATDVYAQAAVLELWDPERSQAVRHDGAIATWSDCRRALDARLRVLEERRGEGLHLLVEPLASPTLAVQQGRIATRFPHACWHAWQPLHRDGAFAGAALAFGQPLEAIYRFERSRIVVALDADFLDTFPGAVRYARDFASTRNAFANRDARSRLYVAESTPTLTGAAADHRLPVRCADVGMLAQALAHALGAHPAAPPAGSVRDDWIAPIVADLREHPGAGLILAGPRQPPEVHALVHALNVRLGNVGRTVVFAAPLAPTEQQRALTELVDAMRGGAVDTLLVLGSNPVYAAPGDLRFGEALRKVPFTLHSDVFVDETAAASTWHVPAAHPLETWSDLCAYDGTASVVQPGIAPLYDGKSMHQLLALVAGDVDDDPRALVRSTWATAAANDAEGFWRESLRSGVVAGTASAPVAVSLASALPAVPLPSSGAIEIVFAPDARLGDGRHANNAWLQELPKPLTQLTWDNAALVSPELAARLGVTDGDEIEVNIGDRGVRAPVWRTPGQVDGSIALPLGYGRTSCGVVGRDRGFAAYALQSASAPWVRTGATVVRTGKRRSLVSAQMHNRMEGRDLVRTVTPARLPSCSTEGCAAPDGKGAATLYATPDRGPYAWAMSIDLSACIGCGACTIACQAENNIPVVGKEEVERGREMHWIRVDRYYDGGAANPRTLFQPVPCMQCEHAPCEVVCPVEASVHDSQGINVQVYNRCVGTRFCSNNCPYKVRRFNFFAYARDEPHLNAQRNPEVTVRMRGVMEKCNYCLQRIVPARIEADREGRPLRDGEVVTACQAVCPTGAIVFGDLADPDSEVSRRKRSPLDYALLAELNTRPRTTYLARVLNPAPGTPESQS